MKINHIYHGNALPLLRQIPDNFIDCCITSPPYYGLRDYQTAPIVWGGEQNCKHDFEMKKATLLHENRNNVTGTQEEALAETDKPIHIFKNSNIKSGFCSKCKAWNGSLGLEPTPELFIEHLTEIFEEVRRTLKPTGTLWLNIGDSFAGSGCGTNDYRTETSRSINKSDVMFSKKPPQQKIIGQNNLKAKDLIGIPWMLAFALRKAGWYLRMDIIWHKPNPMPESVQDRPTKSHEYIFLMSKSPKYYYDYQAILEPANYDGRTDTFFKGSQKYLNGFAPTGTCEQSFAKKGHERWSNKIVGRTEKKMEGTGYDGDGKGLHGHSGYFDGDGNPRFNIKDGIPARNKRSVWTVTTKPYSEAHFATFPQDLIVDCIKAGCPEQVCNKCGKPREKIITKSEWTKHQSKKMKEQDVPGNPMNRGGHHNDGLPYITSKKENIGLTDCGCRAPCEPGIVLDPFMGAGTTAIVARKLNRNYLGIELNEQYIKIAKSRMSKELGMFA